MPSNDSAFAFTPSKLRHDVVEKAASQATPRAANQGVVLDMGEASRLEGFRMNGCR